MSAMKIKPILQWNEYGNCLSWGFYNLVTLKKTERNGESYYMLVSPEFFMEILPEADPYPLEIVWQDEENCDGDCDLYMKDDGSVHEHLKEIYERILADLPCEVLSESDDAMTPDAPSPEKTPHVQQPEQNFHNNGIGDPVGWVKIRRMMNSIRDKIDDLGELIGDIGADNDPYADAITDENRQVLGKIQSTIFHASDLIYSVTPSENGKFLSTSNSAATPPT